MCFLSTSNKNYRWSILLVFFSTSYFLASKEIYIIPSLSGAWCQLSRSCSSCSYIIRFNGASWWTSINWTELVQKWFPLVRKGTRAALFGYSQKKITQFDLELGIFVSEPGPIGSGGDRLRARTEAWGDGWSAGARKGTYYKIVSRDFSRVEA